ncbi:DNA cytosine methyltransferase [Acinetobacter ursingii]|uniref:DNA cytosine methyltransferase n=1 Tax=Acinetobacter TaxID=469 RepID=UPI000F6C9B22|nr:MULTISPECIES: DNA cytosine methyltransferase [Acinetobacter]MDH0008368.1 DNA cytosine methyltransferase [Acinetobacter ursingii]MDH0480180.1 DNA cytosine methyltransferase [Acinetobacter ursingii]MDH2120788.1 DNA cytosine methyltransferase [Acinetobacter ursingii]MDH2128358.1 DNA cytosine methyltransferase [Acinetobacter ursingii]BBF76078.1 DNA-cytosine methyltransferase [Acinetobacter ursingii]
MRYLSLFSGIEAATVAWKPLGWTCVAVSEIEKFPCALLAHYYSNVPNLGDVTKITEEQIKSLGRIDLVVFGSPCQDLSVAGNRKGFDGERSSLFFAAIRIIRWAKQFCQCRFALWENVPGAFSSNKGADFAAVVEQMAGCRNITTPKNGWGSEGAALGDFGLLEWAVLDAQWFGVAQRRKRVFALIDFGNWFDRQPILLEPESLRGNPTQSGRTKKDNSSAVAKCLTRRGAGGLNQDPETANFVVHGSQDPNINYDLAHCLGRNRGRENVVFETAATLTRGFGDRGVDADQIANGNCAIQNKKVRRLTPLECERLQGFPDNYTNIPGATDTPRYSVLGNSMAVPVMRWIGGQIQKVIGTIV